MLNRDAEAEPFAVWPDNADAVRLFCALATQWRVVVVAGLGGGAAIHTGLDYAALPPAARALGLRITEDLFGGVRVMEAAALPILNERR
jgi:hypothetical protein